MAWISKYGYTSLPGTGEEDHDVLFVSFYSRTITEYVVEMSLDDAMLFGSPRDPLGNAMMCYDFIDKAGMAVDGQFEPEPERNPLFDFDLPMVKVEWIVDVTPLRSGKRRRPNRRAQRRILSAQAERCFYCILEFGSWVRRGSRVEQLRVEWDHKIPFAMTQMNSNQDFVAACQVCNRLKHSLVFRTVEHAREYIATRRLRKGWRFVAPTEHQEIVDEWAEWEGRLITFRSVNCDLFVEISEEVLQEWGVPLDPQGTPMIYDPEV